MVYCNHPHKSHDDALLGGNERKQSDLGVSLCCSDFHVR